MTGEPHLTSEEVAAYVDEALSEADSVRIRSHLASCEECRSEVQSVSRLVERAPGARRRFVFVPALAAAAAILVLVGKAATERDSTSEPLRGMETPATNEGVSRFQAVAPSGRIQIGDRIVFVWRPPLPGATYRFTLTDDRGGKVWIGSTNDTSIALPDRSVVVEGRSYRWYVDALLPDGTAATTGITAVQFAR